jgi:hypothetical protein
LGGGKDREEKEGRGRKRGTERGRESNTCMHYQTR